MQLADALSFEPVIAAARLVHGLALERLGEFARSAAELDAAARAGIAGGDEEVTLRAWATLARVNAREEHDEEARRWMSYARAVVQRTGRQGALEAFVEEAAALVERCDRHPAEARRHLERSLQIGERVYGPKAPELAAALQYLVDCQPQGASPERVRQLLQRAYEVRLYALGPEHPLTARSLAGVGEAWLEEGRPAEALAALGPACAAIESALGKDHISSFYCAGSLAQALLAAGQPRQALPLFERKLAGLTAKLGAQHYDTSRARLELAEARLELGEPRAAADLLEKALAPRIAWNALDQVNAEVALAESLRLLGRDPARQRKLASQAQAALPAAAAARRDARVARLEQRLAAIQANR